LPGPIASGCSAAPGICRPRLRVRAPGSTISGRGGVGGYRLDTFRAPLGSWGAWRVPRGFRGFSVCVYLTQVFVFWLPFPGVDAGPSGPSIKNSERPDGRGLDRRFYTMQCLLMALSCPSASRVPRSERPVRVGPFLTHSGPLFAVLVAAAHGRSGRPAVPSRPVGIEGVAGRTLSARCRHPSPFRAHRRIV
jgi:hypothetical protein